MYLMKRPISCGMEYLLVSSMESAIEVSKETGWKITAVASDVAELPPETITEIAQDEHLNWVDLG